MGIFTTTHGFESDVNSDSIQTIQVKLICRFMFESDVNSDSIQTQINYLII